MKVTLKKGYKNHAKGTVLDNVSPGVKKELEKLGIVLKETKGKVTKKKSSKKKSESKSISKPIADKMVSSSKTK